MDNRLLKPNLPALTAFMRTLTDEQNEVLSAALGVSRGFRWISFEPLTPAQIATGKEVAKRHGLC